MVIDLLEVKAQRDVQKESDGGVPTVVSTSPPDELEVALNVLASVYTTEDVTKGGFRFASEEQQTMRIMAIGYKRVADAWHTIRELTGRNTPVA